MDTRQNDRPAEQRRRSIPQTGKTRSGSAPASNAQRRPGSTAPKRRPASQSRSAAQKSSVPKKSDSLTDTRRRTKKKDQGMLANLNKIIGNTSSRAKREEAARAARLKAMRQDVAKKENNPGRRVSKHTRPSQPIVYTQPKAFNAHKLILQLMTVLAVVLALIFGMSVFFKVEVIEVSGAEVYTEWAVREASGIEVGDRLLTFSRPRATGKIYAELPYVDHVRYGIKLPNTVIIDIDEVDVVYAIQSSDGTYYLMSSQGKIVEQTDGGNADNYTKIKGVTLADPVVGQQARAAEEIVATTDEETIPTGETELVAVVTNSTRLATALTILQSLERNGIVGEASMVDVSDLDHMRLDYGTRYEVNLGGSNNIDFKIAAMRDTINKLADYQTGQLDVSFTIREDQVIYTPFS